MKHVYHEISVLLQEDVIVFHTLEIRLLASQCMFPSIMFPMACMRLCYQLRRFRKVGLLPQAPNASSSFQARQTRDLWHIGGFTL